MAGVQINALLNGDAVFTEFKGALTEQYVMQQLRIDSKRYIGYWTNERSTSKVDFVVQDKGDIIPFEVKSGENLRSKSFKLFCEKFTPEREIGRASCRERV
jgi:predicted AAA+ superfamily ATPase